MSDDRRPPTTTNDSGIPVPSDEHSLTVGPNGPDRAARRTTLVQKMQHFNRERVPERVVHAKGSGAHGFFEVTEDVTQWTSASFLSEVGKRTPVFARFSTVAGELGSAGHGPRPARVRAEVLHRGGQLRPGRQQHAGLLRPRRDQVPGLHPLAEADAGHRAALQRHAVGLLDAVAGERAPGDDPDVRPRHPAQLPPHERLQQPHVLVDERGRRAVLGQVPLQDRPGHRELHARRGRRDGRPRTPTSTAATCGTRSPPATPRSGGSRCRSCRSRTPRTTASTRST